MHSTYVMAWNEVTLETGAWLHGAHRTCAETAAVSRGTSHVTTKQRCKYTIVIDIQKYAYHNSAVSLFDSGGQRYIKYHTFQSQNHTLANSLTTTK